MTMMNKADQYARLTQQAWPRTGVGPPWDAMGVGVGVGGGGRAWGGVVLIRWAAMEPGVGGQGGSAQRAGGAGRAGRPGQERQRAPADRGEEGEWVSG